MPRSKSATSADPVEPLGYRGNLFFYRRVQTGEVLCLAARDHTPEGLVGLAPGMTAWAWDAWGDDQAGTHWLSCATYLMGVAFQRGLYAGVPSPADIVPA